MDRGEVGETKRDWRRGCTWEAWDSGYLLTAVEVQCSLEVEAQREKRLVEVSPVNKEQREYGNPGSLLSRILFTVSLPLGRPMPLG